MRAWARFLGLVLTRHQLAAQELADGRFRNVVDKNVAARPLEIGQARFAAELVEFGFLETVCRLSKGNLSSHLSKLEAGGLVAIEKSFRGKRPLTRASITDAGRNALDGYRAQIAALIASTTQKENP